MSYRIFSTADCLNPNKKDLSTKNLGVEAAGKEELYIEYARLRNLGIPVEHIKMTYLNDFVLDNWEFEQILHPAR
jgi:hypothetical protein